MVDVQVSRVDRLVVSCPVAKQTQAFQSSSDGAAPAIRVWKSRVQRRFPECGVVAIREKSLPERDLEFRDDMAGGPPLMAFASLQVPHRFLDLALVGPAQLSAMPPVVAIEVLRLTVMHCIAYPYFKWCECSQQCAAGFDIPRIDADRAARVPHRTR
jgi:hypothetical protein